MSCHPRFIALIALTMTFLAAAAVAEDWPQFLGPDRNNVAKTGKLLAKFPAGGPKVLWSFKLGPGFATPAVRGGKVYVLDRVSDRQDVLRRIDLTTGKEDWNFAYDAPGKTEYDGSRSVPAVDEKYVFTVGTFGHVHCLDLATHKVVWKFNILADYGNQVPMWGVTQNPLLYKDWVILAPCGRQVGVMALDKATGKVAWKSDPIGGLTYASPMLANIGGVDQVIVTAFKTQQASNVAGVDAATGKVLWQYGGWGVYWPIPGAMHLGDGRLVLTGEYGAGTIIIDVKKNDNDSFAVEKTLDLRGAKPPLYASQIYQPLLVDDHLYFVSNGFDRKHGLVCMDLTGKIKWQTGKNPNFELGATLLADGKIWALDGANGQLSIIKPNPEKFEPLDTAKVANGNQCWAPLVIVDGKLLVRDQKELHCLDVAGK